MLAMVCFYSKKRSLSSYPRLELVDFHKYCSSFALYNKYRIDTNSDIYVRKSNDVSYFVINYKKAKDKKLEPNYCHRLGIFSKDWRSCTFSLNKKMNSLYKVISKEAFLSSIFYNCK